MGKAATEGPKLNLGEKARRAMRRIQASDVPILVFMFEDGVRVTPSDGFGDEICPFPISALVGVYDHECTVQQLEEDLQYFRERSKTNGKINTAKTRVHGGLPEDAGERGEASRP